MIRINSPDRKEPDYPLIDKITHLRVTKMLARKWLYLSPCDISKLKYLVSPFSTLLGLLQNNVFEHHLHPNAFILIWNLWDRIFLSTWGWRARNAESRNMIYALKNIAHLQSDPSEVEIWCHNNHHAVDLILNRAVITILNQVKLSVIVVFKDLRNANGYYKNMWTRSLCRMWLKYEWSPMAKNTVKK